MSIFFIPYKRQSPIRGKLWQHYLDNTSKSQLVKNLVLKGWSYKSALIISDAVKEVTE